MNHPNVSESMKFGSFKDIEVSLRGLVIDHGKSGSVSEAQTMKPGEIGAVLDLPVDSFQEAQLMTREGILSLVKQVQRHIGQRSLYEKGSAKEKRGVAALVALGDRIFERFEKDHVKLLNFLKGDMRNPADLKKAYYIPQISSVMYQILNTKRNDDRIVKVYELGYFLLQELTTIESPSTGSRIPRDAETMKSVEVDMALLVLKKCYEKMATAYEVFSRLDTEDNAVKRKAIRMRARGRMDYGSLIVDDFSSILVPGKDGANVLAAKDKFLTYLLQLDMPPQAMIKALHELEIIPKLSFDDILLTFVDLILGTPEG